MNELAQIDEVILEAPDFADYQKAIIDSLKRFTVTEASTKSGKTFSHIYWLFEQAHKGVAGAEYWWIAPVYSQAEIAFKRLMRKVAESGAYIINLSKLTITTPLNTVISFKSADNPNTLYGENVHAFVFDEYSRAKEEAWFALRTTITYTKAKGKFIGNVVARNWAWDLARKAEKGLDPDFEYFKITAYQAVDAGILSLDEVEQAKKDLPDRVFRMLYLAEFTEIEGALWSWDMIDKFRVSEAPQLIRVVIPVDPAVTANDNSDETGIIPIGKGEDGHFYVLGDYTGKYSPENTARRITQAYDDKEGDIVVGEVNNGGDYIESVLKLIGGTMPYEGVHASRGKATRAEPIALLYAQGRVHHVGRLPLLEQEMTTWAPNTGAKSPNRIDSLVWGATYLLDCKQKSDFYVV
jgi:predicted phage terminase large subunit-like protein